VRSVRSLTERGVAVVELGLTAILSFYAAAAFKGAYFPTKTADPSDPANWEAPGWAALGFLVMAPVCVSFAVAGFTMLKQRKHRWWYQLLPLATVSGAIIFLLGPWK
jgi:hypothetical protein